MCLSHAALKDGPRADKRAKRRLRWIARPQLRPGSASREAPEGLRAADEEAVFADRFMSVPGAGRGESALDDAAEVGGNVASVFVDGGEGHPGVERVAGWYEEVVGDPDGDYQDGDSFASGHRHSGREWLAGGLAANVGRSSDRRRDASGPAGETPALRRFALNARFALIAPLPSLRPIGRPALPGSGHPRCGRFRGRAIPSSRSGG